MKTNQEIQAEARQLMVLGSQFQNEQRVANLSAPVAAVPRMLMSIATNSENPGCEWHVEATIAGGELEFRLIEREVHLGTPERDDDGTLLASGDSAYAILRAGYELAEAERLGAALERYAEESDHRSDPADSETVAQVEAILETNLLTPANRLRTKGEIVEFLEGRLESSVLIAYSVGRQILRDGFRNHQTERHDLKLTMGEP